MFSRLRFVFAQLSHDFRVGLLSRPIVITFGLSMLSLLLGEYLPTQRFLWIERLFQGDAPAAQSLLATLASALISMISVVYSILIVALTLASMQFSPRILWLFLSDVVSRTVLGIFLGSFGYCILMLRAIHVEPTPLVPQLGVGVAMLLALLSIFSLIFFIHHLARNLQANYIVSHITHETLSRLNVLYPALNNADTLSTQTSPQLPENARNIRTRSAGYVQLVDIEGLCSLAEEQHLQIWLHVRSGDYLIEHMPFLSVAPAELVTAELEDQLAASIDLGEISTLQQDISFGIRQIVDIALKAISPAVNDPSTAINCIDHLTRILAKTSQRSLQTGRFYSAAGDFLLSHPVQSFARLVSLAFQQIRQYGKGDMAVMLRLAHALLSLAEVCERPAQRAVLWKHTELLRDSLASSFLAAEREEFDARIEKIRKLCQA